MAEPSRVSQHDALSTAAQAPLLAVRLELRCGGGPPTVYDWRQETILIGTVPGCDLRLPSTDLPPLVCVLCCRPSGLHLRKLAPAVLLLVNGESRTEFLLLPNDQLAIGPFKLAVQFSPVRPEAAPVAADKLLLLEGGLRKPKEAQRQFEEDRRDWEQDAERQAEALALRSRQLLDREQALASARSELERSAADLEAQRDAVAQRAAASGVEEQSLAQMRIELESSRKQLHDFRDRLHDHYRKRRDSLTSLQESVKNAAQKVQEQKRHLEADAARLLKEQQVLAQRQEDRAAQAARLEQGQQALAEQSRLIEEWHQELSHEHAERQTRLDAEAKRLGEGREQLAKSQEQHQADLVRLERFHATLQARQTELDGRSTTLDQRATQLHQDALELQEQTEQMEQWDAQLRQQAHTLAQQREEVETATQRLAARAGGLETQQGLLATLRTRAERLQKELWHREQQLTEQRLQLDRMEASARETSRQLQDQHVALRQEREHWLQERRQIEGRCAGLEAALEQMRQVQQSFERTDRQLQQRQAALAEAAGEVDQLSPLLRLRAERVHALRGRLLATRQALRQRETALVQAEQAQATLQEQLRLRSDALVTRERELTDLKQQFQEASRRLQTSQGELDDAREQWENDASRRSHGINQRERELAERETVVQNQAEQNRCRTAELEAGQQALAVELSALEARRHEAAVEMEQIQQQTTALQERLPELAQQAQAVLGRIRQAREQLRGCLGEVHQYSQQAHTELEAAQRELAIQAEQVREQHLQLTRSQADQRHAVSVFRQHLAEWQEQLAELKQSLAQGASNLDRRQAQLEEQARQIDATSARLAERAEQLEDQERDVSRRREELNRHLFDMQRWYRRKLRELAERKLLHPGLTINESAEAEPPILPISSLPTADQQLADLLTGMALIDAETLTALLDEARKRGSSLREALLDGDYLTPFQMELIEAGKLEALVLGPLRVVDRLRFTPLETVYRVFDPRRGAEALLRRLAPSLPEERKADFRERFTRACAVRHPNLAATLEVLDMDDSPAVLQEWTVGVPSNEWAEHAAPPSVWLRLLSQAAAGLQAAHQAGLDHGRLHVGRLLLTDTGELKVCGVGEPAWLVTEGAAPESPSPAAADLRALGQIAQSWLAVGPRGLLTRRGAEPLQIILQRLLSTKPSEQFPSAQALLEHLDRVRAQTAEDASAWEHLLTFVRSRLQPAEEPEERRRIA